MFKRRYADGRGGDDEDAPPSDAKPRAHGSLPSRAWFEAAGGPSSGAWTVTVEHEQRFATSHQGTFPELVQLARRAGVSQFYVWSGEDAGFTPFTAGTVNEAE